ncbi:MAG: hypothetical protein ACRDRO_24295, partial [Pseudonocardiaceae bacterium]
GPEGTLTGVDADPGMVERGRAEVAAAGAGNVVLREGLAQDSGHCCVHRWGARAGCADASSSLCAASAEVKLRWVSVPAGGDHGGCAVVLALWALVP